MPGEMECQIFFTQSNVRRKKGAELNEELNSTVSSPALTISAVGYLRAKLRLMYHERSVSCEG